MKRTRVWDLTREDVPLVTPDTQLGTAIPLLSQALEQHCPCIIVQDTFGVLKGTLSLWELIKFLEGRFRRDPGFRALEEHRYEEYFFKACTACSSVPVADLMFRKPFTLGADEHVIKVFDSFIQHKRLYAVVQEGPRIIGLITVESIFQEWAQNIRV